MLHWSPRRRREEKSLFEERIAENFPNLKKDLDIQVHEVNRLPHNFNPKQSSLRHIIIKLSKIKYRRDFKSSKKKKTHTREPP